MTKIKVNNISFITFLSAIIKNKDMTEIFFLILQSVKLKYNLVQQSSSKYDEGNTPSMEGPS